MDVLQKLKISLFKAQETTVDISRSFNFRGLQGKV